MSAQAPFQAHSPTSKEAARRVSSGLLHRSECELLALFHIAWLTSADGYTDDELIVRFGTQSIRPRRIYLAGIGKLKDSGSVRKTRSGRNAVVWVKA